jgi:hypothetical protein
MRSNWPLTDAEITSSLQIKPFAFDRNKNCGWALQEESIVKLLQAQIDKIQGVTPEQLREMVAKYIAIIRGLNKWEVLPVNQTKECGCDCRETCIREADAILAIIVPAVRLQELERTI